MSGFKGRVGELLTTNRDRILEIVQSRGGKEVYAFGSVVREEDNQATDLDLLVLFDEDASLFDQVYLQRDLEELLGCHVDVLSMNGLRQALDGKGQYRREMMLKEAVLL